MLKTNRTVTHIALNQNDIGDVGARALADALRQSRTLRWLHLNENAISPEGNAALVTAVEVREGSSRRRGRGAARWFAIVIWRS
jgi:hypothetical protein